MLALYITLGIFVYLIIGSFMVDLFAWLNVVEVDADSHTFRGGIVLAWPIILAVLTIILIPLFVGMSAVQIAKTPKAIVKNLPFLKKPISKS